MAFDGAFLSKVRNELYAGAIGSRIDKISQPSREELIILLRGRDGGRRLLLSANAGSSRIHFTNTAPDNPKTPPMFCMLLRKYLSGAKFKSMRQIGLDRSLFLDFEATNELGDPLTLTIAVEIMGRHSNIILIKDENRIIDAIKRIDFETSRVRQILPGMLYEPPPAQDKLNPLESSAAEMIAQVRFGRDIELSNALLERIQGVSPIVCREIAHFATRGVETNAHDLSENQVERLSYALSTFIDGLKAGKCTPTIVCEADGRPRDFTFMPVTQYGAARLTREYASCGDLLDAFYSERDNMERIKQRSGGLLKLLANTSDRIRRKVAVQREELKECAGREQLKIKGDIISANLYALQKGNKTVRLPNFYDSAGDEIEIELDPRLTPPQNAQRYYALYRKADTAEKKLASLIEQGEQELLYIDSVFDALTRSSGLGELDAIREELAQGRYIRRQNRQAKLKRHEKLPPLRYRSSDGHLILAGRNNTQNDKLTLKDSRNTDIWLHTQKIHGAHVVIIVDDSNITDNTIKEAAIIAAYQSQARKSGKVPVDYTLVKHVKKPSGAKPGMVIYDHYKTVYVDPDEELVNSLLEKR